MEVIIRKETADDYSAVYALNKEAFEEESEARLVDALRSSNAFVPELSLVATLENRVVGHILFTKIKIIDDHGNETDSLALAPMAVLPNYQKSGIGSQLVRAGLEQARALPARSVIVLGHEHYYPKFGFEPASKWKITSPFEVPDNVFMALELEKDGLKNVSGRVHYSKEFNEVS